MDDTERRALGRSRRLVFQNLANGVPPERIAAALYMSALEIDQARRFVARKINQHLVLRRQPPVPCDSVREIRWHRRALLSVLSRIGDLDLSTDLILKVETQAIDSNPSVLGEVKHRMAEAHS